MFNNVITVILMTNLEISFLVVSIILVLVLCTMVVLFLLSKRKGQDKQDKFSKMLHDFKTPINSIIGMTYIAGENIKDEQKVHHCLQQIQKNSDYIMNMTNHILEISKLKSKTLVLEEKEFNVIHAMNDCLDIIKPLAIEKSIKIENAYKVIHENIIGDETRLKEIIVNLLSNSVKYTPNGKSIFLMLQEDKEDYCFTVKDTGIGMKKSFVRKMFLPYTQENSYSLGTGLGLTIVKHLIDVMQGSIHVDSEQGKGTTFEVSIPLKKQKTNIPLDMSCLKGMKILLVDDNDINIALVTSILSGSNMVIDVAKNGEEGVTMFHKSNPFYYDALLMDLRMPILDGFEATAQIRHSKRKDAKNVKIIAMTASTQDEVKHASFDGFVMKPIQMKGLLELLIKIRKNEKIKCNVC